MIESAEALGELASGGTVATERSHSTGIGLALVAATKSSGRLTLREHALPAAELRGHTVLCRGRTGDKVSVWNFSEGP
ncbi:MAG: hypothetical protein ABSA31_09155 [Acidimicrobiales bacterium]|jgi:hypothetical protein